MEAAWDDVRPLRTIEDHSRKFPVTAIGNEWSRRYFDGPFYVFDVPPDLPAISLVFVQSRDGNTGADNPVDLGGGPTDLHLIYEGLSRVAADAVLAGASSVGRHQFFTVKHPELVTLRLDLGLARHPIQVVLSTGAHVDRSARLFHMAGAQALVIADTLRDTFVRLRRDHGVRRISCIGGRKTASGLVDAGLVQDIYLTTSAVDGGEPDTPWYTGTRQLRLETIVRKQEVRESTPIVFEHLALR